MLYIAHNLPYHPKSIFRLLKSPSNHSTGLGEGLVAIGFDVDVRPPHDLVCAGVVHVVVQSIPFVPSY